MQAYIHIQPLQWKFLTGFKSIDLTLSTKAYSHNWFTIQFIQICKSHNSKNHNLITQLRIHKHTIEHSTFLIIIPRYISLYPNITIDCFPSLSNSTPYNLSIQYNSTNFDQHNRKLTSHTLNTLTHPHNYRSHTLPATPPQETWTHFQTENNRNWKSPFHLLRKTTATNHLNSLRPIHPPQLTSIDRKHWNPA